MDGCTALTTRARHTLCAWLHYTSKVSHAVSAVCTCATPDHDFVDSASSCSSSSLGLGSPGYDAVSNPLGWSWVVHS